MTIEEAARELEASAHVAFTGDEEDWAVLLAAYERASAALDALNRAVNAAQRATFDALSAEQTRLNARVTTQRGG